jgi:hypothetical protein
MRGAAQKTPRRVPRSGFPDLGGLTARRSSGGWGTANGKRKAERRGSGDGAPNSQPNNQNLERVRRRIPVCVRAEDLYLSPCAPPYCGQYRQAAGVAARGTFRQ